MTILSPMPPPRTSSLDSESLRHQVFGRHVYVAGPYRAATEEARLENVQRACRLSLRLLRLGGIPVCVHPTIHLGGYGRDEDEEERRMGIRTTLLTATLVRDSGGLCAALCLPDGSLSEGTRGEVALFKPSCVFTFLHDEV